MKTEHKNILHFTIIIIKHSLIPTYIIFFLQQQLTQFHVVLFNSDKLKFLSTFLCCFYFFLFFFLCVFFLVYCVSEKKRFEKEKEEVNVWCVAIVKEIPNIILITITI